MRLNWDLALLLFTGLILLLLIQLDLSFLAWLRLVLGGLYVLVTPGYALQAALFPRKDDLDGIERAGLAVGLSIGINPLLALILDASPWGLRLWPMAISLALTVLVFSLAALARRLSLPPQERLAPSLKVDLKGWWAAQERTTRRLYGLIAGMLLVAILSAAAILLLPKPAERYTEFYILGVKGQAQDYPPRSAGGSDLHDYRRHPQPRSRAFHVQYPHPGRRYVDRSGRPNQPGRRRSLGKAY